MDLALLAIRVSFLALADFGICHLWAVIYHLCCFLFLVIACKTSASQKRSNHHYYTLQSLF